MPRAEVPDTTVFVELLRQPQHWPAFQQGLSAGRIWLSSVVVCELYAGTRSLEEARLLDRMVTALNRVQRVLTPTGAEWARAGRLMARRMRVQGALRPRDHLADVLIVVAAARLGATVVSTNVRHLASWIHLANDAGLDVTLTPYPG